MTFHERDKPERFRGFWSLIGMGLGIKVDFCSLYFDGVDLARNLLSRNPPLRAESSNVSSPSIIFSFQVNV